MKRLASLDFMRGLIMVLLALESTGLYEHLFKATAHNYLNGAYAELKSIYELYQKYHGAISAAENALPEAEKAMHAIEEAAPAIENVIQEIANDV